MSRKVITLCASMLLLVSVFGTITQAAEPVVLEFWHIWSGHRQAKLREVLDRFEAAYPHIQVIDVLLTSEERVEKLLVSIAAGMPPDLAMIGRDDAISWGQAGYLVPLKQYIERDFGSVTDIMYPPIASDIMVEGEVYYIPHVIQIDTLLYGHADLLEESGVDSSTLPATLDELRETARKLTRRDASGPTQLGMDLLSSGPGGRWRVDAFKRWLHTFGGGVFNSSGEVVLNSPQALETLTWMRDFNDSVAGGIAELKAFYSRFGSGQETNFGNGRVAMLMWGDYVWGVLRGRHPDLRMTMGLMPMHPEVGPRSIVAPGWGYGNFSYAYPDETWLLLRWLTLEAEGGLQFALGEGRASVVPEANLNPLYFDQHAYWHVFIDAVNKAVPWYSGPPEVDVTSVLDQLVGDTLFEETVGFAPALEEAERLLRVRLREAGYE